MTETIIHRDCSQDESSNDENADELLSTDPAGLKALSIPLEAGRQQNLPDYRGLVCLIVVLTSLNQARVPKLPIFAKIVILQRQSRSCC
jgi:hypothetical protein